jgi:hypothetical protein
MACCRFADLLCSSRMACEVPPARIVQHVCSLLALRRRRSERRVCCLWHLCCAHRPTDSSCGLRGTHRLPSICHSQPRATLHVVAENLLAMNKDAHVRCEASTCQCLETRGGKRAPAEKHRIGTTASHCSLFFSSHPSHAPYSCFDTPSGTARKVRLRLCTEPQRMSTTRVAEVFGVLYRKK